MRKLIRLELERFSIKPHLIGLFIANLVILLLCVMVSTFIQALGGVMAAAGLPEFSLTTVSLSVMLVRATLIVWQGALIAKLIVEEYQSKTIGLLFTYPISFKKIIWAKIALICGFIFLFHVISNIFQNVAVYLISGSVDFVTYQFEGLTTQLIIIISTILLGLVPLAVGMLNKSTIATVVSSVVIVAFSSNSQGSTAGLLSIPIVACILGVAGLLAASVTVKKMLASDLLV